MTSIPITRPVVGEEEVLAIAECLRGGWLVQGPKVAEFERRFSQFTQSPHARATTSCTTALHLALLCVGVRPGDEVIVPAFTWVATANAVVYCGATPVFADIDPVTFTIDLDHAATLVSERTRAIIPVHEFGLSADMRAVDSLSHRYGLRVVEDAACACGARYDGVHVGTFGDAGCFSFHPRKAITTGEGGMVTTADPGIARRVEVLRSHGAQTSDLERHGSERGFALAEFNMLGFNYRMTDIQAAMGLVQMDRLDGILRQRRILADVYNHELAGLEPIATPFTPDGYEHAFQSYVLRVRGGRTARDAAAVRLQEMGISTRQGTHAVHALGYYRATYGLRPEDLPQAWAADGETLALPLFAGMTEAEQARVVESVRKVFG